MVRASRRVRERGVWPTIPTSHQVGELFEARFDPSRDGEDTGDLRTDIQADLDTVESLDEDRILRGFSASSKQRSVPTPTVPTVNRSASSCGRQSVPGMPKPYPLYEIFVYAPEGRRHPPARRDGGSRRACAGRPARRTTAPRYLGLMKAQMTKNAVIVPTGSKGGFVLRRTVDPADLKDAVKDAYLVFVRGLLDVTDNLVGGRVVHPPGVKVLDGEDPYLVVAADKGTATFSDAANELSAEYGYWLGDAFASGGSAGYDHKELGITARGGWECSEVALPGHGTGHRQQIPSPSSGSATCPGTCSATACSFPNRSASSPPSTTATSSLIPTRTRK